MIIPAFGGFGSGGTPGGGGGYTLQTVDNQGTAEYTKSGSFDSDSTNFWFSFWFNIPTGAASGVFFDVAGRSIAQYFSGGGLDIVVVNTSATTVCDITTGTITTDTLHHVYFAYDGSAGTFAIYLDGVDISGSVTVTVAATTGTVDHSRATVGLLTSIDFQEVGDMMFGAGTPPGIAAVYPAQDISGVTATVKVSGDATVWNTGPAGYTVTGTFV